MPKAKDFVLPSIFGVRGEFIPLSDFECSQMSDSLCASYQAVADAYNENLHVERAIERLEKTLFATVRELRAAQEKAARLPKPTFLDNWRAMRAAG